MLLLPLSLPLLYWRRPRKTASTDQYLASPPFSPRSLTDAQTPASKKRSCINLCSLRTYISTTTWECFACRIRVWRSALHLDGCPKHLLAEGGKQALERSVRHPLYREYKRLFSSLLLLEANTFILVSVAAARYFLEQRTVYGQAKRGQAHSQMNLLSWLVFVTTTLSRAIPFLTLHILSLSLSSFPCMYQCHPPSVFFWPRK